MAKTPGNYVSGSRTAGVTIRVAVNCGHSKIGLVRTAGHIVRINSFNNYILCCVWSKRNRHVVVILIYRTMDSDSATGILLAVRF